MEPERISAEEFKIDHSAQFMEEELKRKAYLEGQKLKKAGYDDEVIRARLDKQGIPAELIGQVLMNLNRQKVIEVKNEQKPLYYSGLLKIGLGVLLAIISYIAVPGVVILPIGFIAGGVIYVLLSKR